MGRMEEIFKLRTTFSLFLNVKIHEIQTLGVTEQWYSWVDT